MMRLVNVVYILVFHSLERVAVEHFSDLLYCGKNYIVASVEGHVGYTEHANLNISQHEISRIQVNTQQQVA